MKISSRKTVLTAAVLVSLSSSTGLAATQGTVDSQELFHANRLVTDPVHRPAVEENAASDRSSSSAYGISSSTPGEAGASALGEC